MPKAHKAPVVNRVLDSPTVPWRELKKFEANRLKDSESRKVGKLKKSILEMGFSFPLFAWNPGNNVDPIYVIDGAGRIATLTQMEKDGHEICDIPVVFIQAESREHALRLVPAVSSQFGVATAETFAQFAQPLGGAEALAPMVSISSLGFATDYIGPAVNPEAEEEPRSRREGSGYEPPEFEAMDIIEFGNHQLMVGHDEDKSLKLIKKISKLIAKEAPEMKVLRNGEPLC